jgi:hypothetical protein
MRKRVVRKTLAAFAALQTASYSSVVIPVRARTPMTIVDVGSVIASHPVGAKRRRMTGSAKQSRAAYDALDCFVANAPRNDGKIRLNLNSSLV